MAKKIPLVSVIAPAHNEQLFLADFTKSVIEECDRLKLDYELIIVENGSQDDTWKITQELAFQYKQIKPISLKIAGYGLALIEGIKAARGRQLVIFNVDFWDKRFLQLTLIDMMGYDIISGSKLLPGSSDQRGLLRKMITWGFNKFVNLVLGYKGTDTHGIKLIDREKILPVLKKCQTTTGIFDTELMVRSQRSGLKILELPVAVKEIRPARFSWKRPLKTPLDIYTLWSVLR